MSAPPIKVESAYGGLGIYRMSSIRHCWYGNGSMPDVVGSLGQPTDASEHYRMNQCAGKVYMLPGLVIEWNTLAGRGFERSCRASWFHAPTPDYLSVDTLETIQRTIIDEVQQPLVVWPHRGFILRNGRREGAWVFKRVASMAARKAAEAKARGDPSPGT